MLIINKIFNVLLSLSRYVKFYAMFTVLMVMTLTALWLEPKSFERMVIVNLNFICHLLCIQDIHWEVPKSGFNVPKLSKCR